jgi:mono/diheme cytochrome c family protein
VNKEDFMSRRNTYLICVTLSLTLLAPGAAQAADPVPQKAAKSGSSAKVERGKYLVKIAGCNDCHTAGYMANNGKVDEKQWLTGDTMGWRGPWGTTYAPNLRLYFDKITEDQWVKSARVMETRPPMPWFAVRDMTERDLRAIHAYIKSRGPAGGPAPAYVPPDKEPKPPFAQFPSPPPAKK